MYLITSVSFFSLLPHLKFLKPLSMLPPHMETASSFFKTQQKSYLLDESFLNILGIPDDSLWTSLYSIHGTCDFV